MSSFNETTLRIRQLLEKRQVWMNLTTVYAEMMAIYNEVASQMILNGPRFQLVEFNGQNYRITAYIGSDGSPYLSFEHSGCQEENAVDDQYGSFIPSITSPSYPSRRQSRENWV